MNEYIGFYEGMTETATPAGEAVKLINFVSGEYSGSKIGQGAGIALECQSAGNSPSELLLALLSSPDHIQQICDEGTRVHMKIGRGPVPLPPEHVVFVAKTAMTYAEAFMSLDRKTSEEIPQLSRVAYKTGPRSLNPEFRLQQLVDTELRKRNQPRIDFEKVENDVSALLKQS